MARTPSMSAAECEAILGPRGRLSVTSDNRQHVQKWLTARGVPASVAKSARLGTLASAYNDTTDRYLTAMIRNAETRGIPNEPEAEPDQIIKGREAEIVIIDDPAAGEPVRIDDQQEPQPDMTPRPKNTPAGADEAARKLGEALQMIAGMNAGPVNEERVIELIRKHGGAPDEATLARLIKTHGTVRHEIIIQDKGETRQLPDEPRHEIFAEALRVVSAGCNLFLVGPAGSGKTTLAAQIAKALNLPFHFNGALDSPYKLSGFIDAQGRVVSTAFRRAYQDGGVYLFDEIDASLPGALLAFNAALANGHADFPDGTMQRHENFRCIAAANTFGLGADRQYVGRNQLDAASLDRFVMLEMPYDEKLERQLAGDNDWTEFVQKARRAVATLKLRHVISPRASINGAKLLGAGMERKLVERVTLWKGMSDADVAKVRATMKGE